MATQVDESTVKLIPEVVGNAFAEQYYNTLSKYPELLHKFYNDSSLISRPGLDGSVSSASTLEEIKKLILSLDYKNCVVEIQTVDSQESYENAVMVIVTGFFAGKDSDRKRFTQAFFLVQQDDGTTYDVMNDIFRYVEESENKKISDADNIAPPTPVTPSPEPASVPDHTVVVNVSTNSEDGGVQAKESGHPLDNGEIPTSEKDIVVEKEVVATQNDARPVSEAVASSVQEDAPKKSYASVVNALNLKSQPFQRRVSDVKPVKQSFTAVPPMASSHQTGSPLPPGNNIVEINNNSTPAEGCSIFVANLPMDATNDELIQAFSKFGAIKPNGVQVRSYKQDKNCFGFVEFESANSVEKALEVSTVKIGTRTAHIERKNAKTDGERYRKGGFRNDNFRNRGNYGGGRGHGRNDFENQGGVSGQARSAAGRNGEANKKVYQNGWARGPRQAQAGRS
ncbi:PREDICTED: putative G3BP-like protein [Populus euphratica]|uniref:G3BP-like protein n=1 Tax=Populus euphratica TaxID=75702 RepID=A0AAJ6TXU5_POPEU|nr:PREDICTED: putative G3BP-like protein [Populus euphratica]